MRKKSAKGKFELRKILLFLAVKMVGIQFLSLVSGNAPKRQKIPLQPKKCRQIHLGFSNLAGTFAENFLRLVKAVFAVRLDSFQLVILFFRYQFAIAFRKDYLHK